MKSKPVIIVPYRLKQNKPSEVLRIVVWCNILYRSSKNQAEEDYTFWPKIFQNLRASRAGQLKSEAADYRFASQVAASDTVSAWKKPSLLGLPIVRETLQTREVGDEGLRQNAANACIYRLKITSENSVGTQVGAKLPLSQVVALLIDRWDELDEEDKIAVQVIIDR